MAETSGPWAGSTFAEDEWRDLFSVFPDVRATGIGEESNFNITRSSSDRNYTVGPGKAWIQGALYESDDDIVFDVPVPSSGNQRIDIVAFRYDASEVALNDRVQLVLIQGQEASNPSEPTLTRERDGVWEVMLSRIGPYGSGPISGAPHLSSFRAAPSLEFTNSVIDPNSDLQRYPGGWRNILITGDGKLWSWEGDEWELRTQQPQTGSISAANGWSSQGAQWRLSADGLVTLRGEIERTGSQITLPRLAQDAILITGNLPSAIRPSTQNPPRQGDSVSFAAGRPEGVGSDFGYFPVAIRFDDNNRRLLVYEATGRDNSPIMNTGNTVHLNSLSWWVD